MSPFWTAAQGPFFRPLLSLSLIIDHALWNLNATGYHTTNIVFHSINSFLVFLVALLLLNTSQLHEKRIWNLAFLSGFIFLIHPSHTESVAWISGRTDVVATFFCLLSFYIYLLYKQYAKAVYIPISIFLFLCSLLSKESVIAYPLVILVYEVYTYTVEGTTGRKRTSILYLPLLYGCALVLYLSMRFIVIGTIIGGYGGGLVHLNVHPVRMLKHIVTYSTRALLPPIPHMTIAILIFAGSLLAVTLLILRSVRKGLLQTPSIIYFLVAAFIVSLIPVLNLRISLVTTQGERFIYLPSFFYSILMVVVLGYIFQKKKYFSIAFIFLLLFYGVSIYSSNKNWREAGTISKDILYSLKTMERTERLFIINLPDHINGAYIYRNGIVEALNLFGHTGQFKKIVTISFNNVYDVGDEVDVTERFGHYSVRLLNPQASFIRFSKPQGGDKDIGYFEIENAEKRSFDLKLKSVTDNDKLAFYSAGVMELYGF